MPGGTIAPDGRPMQAPGIGKNAKRHDLEGTPGLHDSSLQQGDVAMLEEGQRSQKQVQKAAAPPPAPASAGQPAQQNKIVAPDAIDFIGSRAQGGIDASTIGQNRSSGLDASRWKPLMRELARDPNTSGPLTTAMLSRLSQLSRQTRTVGVDIIDINGAEDALRESFS